MSVMLSASQPNRPIAIIVSRLIDDEECCSLPGDCFDGSSNGEAPSIEPGFLDVRGFNKQGLCLLYVVSSTDLMVLRVWQKCGDH